MAKRLSKADLTAIANHYVDRYYQQFHLSKTSPEPIDPELLASSVLDLNIKMFPLCSDGSILGLTVFQKCSFAITLADGTQLIEVFTPQDIVVSSALAGDKYTGCRNFTIAHETAHQILIRMYPDDYPELLLRSGHIAYRDRTGSVSWAEWQADTLAAALLMPDFLIQAEIDRVGLCIRNGLLYKSASDANYQKILDTADHLGVSWTALRIKLQQMGIIRGKPIHCHPLDIFPMEEDIYGSSPIQKRGSTPSMQR